MQDPENDTATGMLSHPDVSRRLYHKGTIIFSEGKEGEALYIVQKGRIRLSKQVGDERFEIGIIADGEMFGEMAVIDGGLRMATATAASDTTLIIVPKRVFDRRAKNFDSFAFALVNILVDNLRNVHRIYLRKPRSLTDHINALDEQIESLRKGIDTIKKEKQRNDSLLLVDEMVKSLASLARILEGHKDRRNEVMSYNDD